MKGPEAYVHGLPGSRVVVLPGHVAAWLQQHARLDDVRERRRPSDPETVAVLVALALVAREFNTLGSVPGTIQAPRAEPAPTSGMSVSTGVAAGRLGIGDRAVRKALREGRLDGQLIDGRWQVTADSIARYRSAA